MEVSFGSFSIREYTARMRRVDAGKCWPFDGDGGGRSELPPIECRRYRWWSSELQIARSAAACEPRAGAAEQASGVVSCADATVVPGAEESRGGEPSGIDGEPVVGRTVLLLPAHEASTVKEDENGEEDGRQARSPGKAKVRTPKKRSIVELFAVAPQIEAAGDEAEGDDKVLAVDKAPEGPKHGDQLSKGAVEEPRKRREESMETLMRKKIKKNRANKNKDEENLKKKKTKMKKKKKKKKKKQKLLKTQKQQKNSIKIGIAKKEKICKSSLQSPAELARLLQDAVVVKRLGKGIEVPVCAEGRKPTMSKRASKQYKVKTVQASQLKKQLSEPKSFPIHSILKNQKTVSPGIGKLHITDGSQNGEGHCAQQSEKHVRFSGKDDILGQGERHCSSLGSPQMQSLCKVFSDVLEASSVMDKSPEGGKLAECGNKAQLVTADEDTASDHADKGKTDEPLPLQQLTVIHDVTNATSANPQGNHEKKKIALDDRVDLNNSVQVLDDLNQIDPCSTEPFLKVMTSSQPEGCDAQVVDDPGKKTSRLDADRGLPSQSAAEITLLNVLRNSNSEMGTCSLSADVVANESKSHFYPVVDHNMDVYAYDSQFNSSHLLKMDRMSTICSTGSMRQLYHMDNFLESRAKANPADRFHDKQNSGNIVGLPLNSQGEYIHLQPSAQFGLDQLFKKQRMMLDPVSNFLVHNSIDPSSNDHINVKGKGPLSSAYVENQQKWVPEKFSRAQSIVMPVSGFSELQGINQTGVRNKESVRKYDQFGSNLNVEANLIRGPFHGFREQNQSHRHNDRAMAGPVGASEPGSLPVTQPTMRLMGKNFIVGSHDNIKEYQGSGDSKIWGDKKVAVDLHPALRMSEETTIKCWPGPEWPTHPASGTSYENLMHTLEMQEKHRASNFYHLTVDPGSDNAHLDYGLGIISGNSCHSVSFSHGYKLDTFSHPHAREAWLSKASMSKKSRGSESESLKMGFQAPLAVCNPENVCQHLLLNSTHCKHSQSLSCSMTSAFPPSSAFQDPGNGKYSQLPMAPHSSQSLPHWLLNAGQDRNTSNPSVLSFPDPIPTDEPRTKSGHSIFPLPSPPFTSIVPFSSLGQNSHVCFSDLPTPASLVHPSLYPPFPAAKSSSTKGTCYWNMCNSRDDMKSKYPFLKGSDFANRTRKRPSPCSNDFLKPIKKPNLCTHGDSGTSMGSKRGDDLHVCTEHVSKMLELHSEDKTVKINDAVKDTHPPSTSKLDIGSRSRPVKLSAGAKHILKPSVNKDQDKSMPTHSTIPFARGSSSGEVPVSQKKPAKIYQFR